MNKEKKTASVLTLGCKVNQYESEAIAEKLEENGFTVVPFGEACEVAVINTCTVTSEGGRKARQMIRRTAKEFPSCRILVTGCDAQLEPEKLLALPGVVYVCGTRNKMSVIAEALRAVSGNTEKINGVVPPESGFEEMKINRFDRTRAYVKIQDGCNAHCTYCIIPHVRGDIVSRKREDVIGEIRTLAASGCPEVVLTGIETSAYEYGLSGLMEEIEEIGGIRRVRLGSLDPSFMKPAFTDAIAPLSKTAHHFHLSLQSGSDRILAKMKRKYNRTMALNNMNYLRSVMPDVMFSTDVMTGFPGETEEDFLDTVDFARRARFLHIHVFTYSRRPGTPADKMTDQVPEDIKIERSHRLIAVGNEIRNDIFRDIIDKGESLEVLIETVKNGIASGHTGNFIECVFPVPDCENLRGTFVNVQPVGIDGETLRCEVR